MAVAPAPVRASTHWGAVSLAVGAGVMAALQVGKAAIATPMLQSDFGLDLAAIGWLNGVFAVLGLICGIPAGALVVRAGSRRVLLLGLLIVAAGAAGGAMAGSFAPLLAARMAEGAGFLLIIVAAPTIIAQETAPAQRNLAFAMWGCFMPTGMAAAMLAGPLFDGWRALWWTGGSLALAIAVAIAAVVPADPPRASRPAFRLGADALATVRAGGPPVLAVAFGLYSLMFFALFSFLPVLLMERMQVTHQTAGLLSALATAANVTGNIAGGILLSRGVGRPVLLAGASLFMGAAGVVIFMSLLPDTPTFILCVLFSAVGGLIPATLLSSAPILAPAGLVPVTLGLIMQGNSLGQITGPVAVGNAIQAHGWAAAGLIVAAAATLAIVNAAALARAMRRHR